MGASLVRADTSDYAGSPSPDGADGLESGRESDHGFVAGNVDLASATKAQNRMITGSLA